MSAPSEPDAARPRLRGRLHQVAFFVVLALGPALIIRADGATARLAAAVYIVSLSALFGVSALYHRVDWPAAKRAAMRRLDHTMIFVLIAGTYTVIAGLALPPVPARWVLGVIWGGALVGGILQVAIPRTPKWLQAVIYLALGWTAVAVIPLLLQVLPRMAFGFLIAGGVLYSLGAITYATKRPDPAPATFGYHEVFHAFTIGAAVCHFVTAWYTVA